MDKILEDISEIFTSKYNDYIVNVDCAALYPSIMKKIYIKPNKNEIRRNKIRTIFN